MVLGNGVVQLVVILDLQRLPAVCPEVQVALREDGDEVEALKPRVVGVVDQLDL